MLFDFFLQNHWFEVLDVVSLVEVRRSGEVTEEIVHQVELLSFSGLAVDEVGTTFSGLVCSDIPIVTIGEDTLRYIEIDVDRLVVWVGEMHGETGFKPVFGVVVRPKRVVCRVEEIKLATVLVREDLSVEVLYDHILGNR